jgi:hypothetical protein
LSSSQEITNDPCSTDLPALLLPIRLETRRIGNDLCIRVFPDQPFIDAHRVELTQEEHDAALKLRAALCKLFAPSECELLPGEELPDDPDLLLEVARGEWREFARRYSPNRAAWILESLLREEDVPIEDDQKSFVPRLFLLPERFIFRVYKDDVLAYQEAGADIAPNLTLLPAPSSESSETSETQTPLEDGLFDAQSRWITNFDAAVEAGLAIKIGLRSGHAADPKLQFSQIVVVGLRSELESEDEPLFAQFVRAHRHTEGFEFLPYGTPTNNTQERTSGHSESEEELLASFEYEVLSPLSGLTDGRRSATAYAELSRAIGLFAGSGTEIAANPLEDRAAHAKVLARIKGAGLSSEAPLPHMVDALWPSTGDYFFATMLGYTAGRKMLAQHASWWLRPHGPLPSIRVGNQPYGILPVTRIKRAADPSAWKEDERDHPNDGEAAVRKDFDAALHNALSKLLEIWLKKAGSSAAIPRAGGGGDQDEELLQLIGMSPHSLDYRARPIVDQALVAFLMSVLGNMYFGRGSSFDGLVPERDSAIPTWVDEKNKITNATIKVLNDMGGPPRKDALLLRAFAWGDGAPLTMALVRNPDDANDGPENYLYHLTTIAPRGSALPSYSQTLLYDLVRRSYQLVVATADSPAAITMFDDVVAKLYKPGIEFFGRQVSAEEIEVLARQAPKADPFPEDDIFKQIAAASPFTSLHEFDAEMPDEVPAELATNLKNKLRDALDKRLAIGLRDVIDALTCRLDAWYTSLATQRLFAMRQRNPKGVYFGAYGYVEDLKLPPPAPPGAAGGGGFVHAPSVAHASAAAILRSAFESHRHDEDGNAYALNLTSDRVDRALAFVDGVQQGQDLPALLGYHFERRLHDEGLDRVIDVFRTAFPITEPDEDEETDAAAESIAARHVCDGRKLASAYVENDPAVNEALALAELGADDRETVRSLLAELADGNDAVGDVLLFEGVYQAVQGNVDRCGSALDACAGLGKPPELESMSTPGGGNNVRHRVCLFLPGERPPTPPEPGPREAAEPRLNAWLGSIFGPLSDIRCAAYFTPPNGAESRVEGEINLGSLYPAVSPLDFLYMCAVLPSGTGDTEIEVRLRRRIRSLDSVAPGSSIRLALGEAAGRSVADAMELGRVLLEMLGNAAPITAASLMHPDDVASMPNSIYSESEVDNFAGRVGVGRAASARQLLDEQKGSLENAATVLDALDVCAGFGIGEAVVEVEDDASHLQRGKRVLAIVDKRSSAAQTFIDTANAAAAAGKSAQAIEAASNALKELFGASFITLSAINVLDIEQPVASFDTALPASPSNERRWLWLQQVAETHPRVRHFETALMAAQAWGAVETSRNFGGLKIAQLTPGLPEGSPVYGWQALSDDELVDTPGRVRGAQSIVAMLPVPSIAGLTPLDSGQLVGFVMDEWTEKLAAPTVTTAISFEYNQPASQAPQCFLLAVPGNYGSSRWDAQHLAEIVRETMVLAKARLVDLDALATVTASAPDVTGIFPALMFPISATLPTLFPTEMPIEAAPAPVSSHDTDIAASRTANAV